MLKKFPERVDNFREVVKTFPLSVKEVIEPFLEPDALDELGYIVHTTMQGWKINALEVIGKRKRHNERGREIEATKKKDWMLQKVKGEVLPTAERPLPSRRRQLKKVGVQASIKIDGGSRRLRDEWLAHQAVDILFDAIASHPYFLLTTPETADVATSTGMSTAEFSAATWTDNSAESAKTLLRTLKFPTSPIPTSSNSSVPYMHLLSCGAPEAKCSIHPLTNSTRKTILHTPHELERSRKVGVVLNEFRSFFHLPRNLQRKLLWNSYIIRANTADDLAGRRLRVKGQGIEMSPEFWLEGSVSN